MLVWVAFSMALIVASAVGAVDMGILYVLRNRLQATADAAALAGVSQFPGDQVGVFVTGAAPELAAVIAVAADYAERNMSAARYGTVLCTPGRAAGDCLGDNSDVVVGHWQGADARRFTCYSAARDDPTCPRAATSTTNAVKVVARMSDANANAASTYFLRYFGRDSVDIVTAAVAEAAAPNDCVEDGIVANRIVMLGSRIDANQACIYGRDGVVVGMQNSFCGAAVGMADLAHLDVGPDNACLGDALFAADYGLADTAPLAGLAGTVAGMTAMMNNAYGQIPFDRTYEGGELEFPSAATTMENVIRDALITASGDVAIGSGATLENVTILADGEVRVGAGFVFSNVIIIARGNVRLGGDGKVCKIDDDTGTCAPAACGDQSSQIVAGETIVIGPNAVLHRTQIVAGQAADLRSDFHRIIGSPIQAGTEVRLGSDVALADCDRPASRRLSNGLRLRLVR